MDQKCANPDFQLDVDVMLLDFLLYSATEALLKECKERQSGNLDRRRADDHLRSVRDFLDVFRINHPKYEASPELRFRLRLLQFATLFCRRLERDHTTPTIQTLLDLRQENAERAKKELAVSVARVPALDGLAVNDTLMLIFPKDRKNNRARQLSILYGGCKVPDWATDSYGTEYTPTLIDLLPAFIMLSAEIATGDPSMRFMLLAVEFMLQSALEQQLMDMDEVCVNSATEAFAWGCWFNAENDMEIDGHLGPDMEMIKVDVMFRDFESNDEGKEWTNLRQEFAEKLQPPEGISVGRHILTLLDDYPILIFERRMLEYLGSLSSVNLPVIVQLESGQIQGLSKQQTARLKGQAG